MNLSTKKHLRNGHGLASDWLKIKSAFSDTATNVKDTAGSLVTESVDRIKNSSAKVKDDISVYTAKKPLKSLGIAVLVGFAVGFLIRK